ncbi:MAG: glucosamine-6-phosphate deaminase [Clostridia bacterium]|nr:glucosamine-6-phosphate deaminase [Clostridia bacterium]
MKFVTVESYAELSKMAADIIKDVINSKPDCVLGLATGSSPVGTYEKLAEYNKNGEVDFSKVTSVNLDEYVGLDGTNDQSYRYFMNKNLFDNVNIDKAKTFVPNGCAEDTKAEGEKYDALIKDLGGIDLQLLGIGLDGHIGFNEPDDVFVAPTHEVKLDESTIEANSRFFASKDDVPKSAVTMGMLSIMNAKKILMVANGKNKEEILNASFYGPITPKVPASILQLHPDVTVIYSKN